MTGERPQGKTNLMTACEQGRALEAKIILQKKPQSISIRDKHGKTALHYCAESGALACAQLLVSGADRTLLDAPDSEGFTPLHLAIISGHKSIARLLLRAGADPDSVDKERHSVVHWAAVCGDNESLDLLLNHGANPSTPDILGAYPIHYAAQMCGAHNVSGKDPETGLNTLRNLVQKGASIQCRDKDGREPLLWAASAGSSEAVLVLFTAGANISTSDKDGLTALHCAASRGHTACVETLITLCGSKVDSGDHIGCSPLFYAAAQGQADCAQVLLKHGADPNRQDNKGRTPAHCAAVKGRLEILRILDSNGADLWIRNSRGNLPLHEAVVSGRKDLVQWLLQQCPRAVNATNISGRTPLHIAAQRNNVEMCEVLIDFGAFINPLMVNAKGFLMTPLDASVYQGNQRCAKYLQLHGAVPATKVLENNEINRNLLFSLGNYAYSQKERSDEEPPTSAVFDPSKDILQSTNVRDAQTRTIRGGQQPPLPPGDVPPESELTNVISEDTVDASVHIHLTRDDLWSLWESLMQELTSEMSGSELSQGSERKQKHSRRNAEVRQLKPVLTNVYMRRESGRSQVIAGESIFDRATDRDDVPTRSVSEDPRLRYPKRATDDFKSTLPKVSEAEKSKSTEDDRNTASSQISGMHINKESNVKSDDDVFEDLTDSVGSDTENVTSGIITKTTRFRKRRSDARSWVKELEESETSSANRQERREGNPYMKRYFQRQARAAEMRKYLEAQNFRNEDEYQTEKDTRREISENFDDSQEYDDDYNDDQTRFPHLGKKEKAKRSKRESKSHDISLENVKDNLPNKPNKLHRSKASSALNLDNVYSPRHTKKKRSKHHKECDCIKDSEEKIVPETWHSEECHLRRHRAESSKKSGKKKIGTSSTRDMGRKSSKNFLEVPSQHSAAASDERSEDISQEEIKRRHHHYHHHHHHYHHHHYHRQSVTPDNENYISEDHYLEKHHKHKRHYHGKKSAIKYKNYPDEYHIERQIFSDGEYERYVKDIHSGYDIPRSKSEMTDIPWYSTRDVLTQSPVPETCEKESSEMLGKDLEERNKSQIQDKTTEQHSKLSKTFDNYEESFKTMKKDDSSKSHKEFINVENMSEYSSRPSSQDKKKINLSLDNNKKNGERELRSSNKKDVKETKFRRESKKPGKPPLKPAQSFSGTLSQKTRNIPLKQKSQSARIEKDLPEIRVFSVEGDETNLLVRTDFSLKDVSEASENASNGDNIEKSNINKNVHTAPTAEVKNATEASVSDKDILEDERQIEIQIEDSPAAEMKTDAVEEEQMNENENINSENNARETLKKGEDNIEIFVSNQTNITDTSETFPDTEIAIVSEQKHVDTLEDDLSSSSSSENDPDEVLYRDENYALEIEDKKQEDDSSTKFSQENDAILLNNEISKDSYLSYQNAHSTGSNEEKSEIIDKNKSNNINIQNYELKQTSKKEGNIEVTSLKVNDNTHLNILDKSEHDTAISNEENEEKSPCSNTISETMQKNKLDENACVTESKYTAISNEENEEKSPYSNNISETMQKNELDENASVTESKYSDQYKIVTEIAENINSDLKNTSLYENISEKVGEQNAKTDESILDLKQLTDVTDKSEYEKSNKISETVTKNKYVEETENRSTSQIDIKNERKDATEENPQNVNEQEIPALDVLSDKSKDRLAEEIHTQKSDDKIFVDQNEMLETVVKNDERLEKDQFLEHQDNTTSKLNEDQSATDINMVITENRIKEYKDKKEEIELVEETARNEVLSIIQQAESEIQRQFGTNALQTRDLDLLSNEQDVAPDNLSIHSPSFSKNEEININIIEATPNYKEPTNIDENGEFSDPQSASEAETKFNTDSEDTQPEPDLDPVLLSGEAQKDDEPAEIKESESTPDLILLAKTLEAETRALAARDDQQEIVLDRKQDQNGTDKKNRNEINKEALKTSHTGITKEKDKTNSKPQHHRDSQLDLEVKEDDIVNMHEKHRRKSKYLKKSYVEDSQLDLEIKEDDIVHIRDKHRRMSKDLKKSYGEDSQLDLEVNIRDKHRRKSKSFKKSCGEDIQENQKINSKSEHHQDLDANLVENKDEIMNEHGKHRRKSRDSRAKYRKSSKPNLLIHENTEENGDVIYTENVKEKNNLDHDFDLTRQDIMKNEKKRRKTLEEEYENLKIEVNDASNSTMKKERKSSVIKEISNNSLLTAENTSHVNVDDKNYDKKQMFFPSTEVQTDISGETKISEIGINVEKEISSHIGFNRSISVQTADYDTSVVAVLEKVQKEEAENIPQIAETHKTISIQTEVSDIRVNHIFDQSDEIKEAIRTANYNDISGKSRSLATQSLETLQSTDRNGRSMVSVAVDATKRSPERQNPSAVFYTAQPIVVNESPKKEKQNIGAVFYAATSMNDRYDVSSISTPNLYTEKLNDNKKVSGGGVGRGRIPRSTIRDRSLESERAVAIANTAFRRLNSKGELTVFNSSLITAPHHVPVPHVEAKPTYKKEYSNLEKSGFLWVHFGSGSSPISTVKRKPNLTSQKGKRESKLVQNQTTRNIEEVGKKIETKSQVTRRSEMRNEGKINIYSRAGTQRKTDERTKMQATKSKGELNEALHVSSKVLTNKTSRKVNAQTTERTLEQNERRSRIPYKYSDYDVNRSVDEFNTNSKTSQMKKQSQAQTKSRIPEIDKSESSPRRAIPRLCREESSIRDSSDPTNTPRVKIKKVYDKMSDISDKKDLIDDSNEMKNKMEIKHEKSSKGKGNLKMKEELQHKSEFPKSHKDRSPYCQEFHSSEQNSNFEDNLDSENVTVSKKDAKVEKRSGSKEPTSISDEIGTNVAFNDYNFETDEFENLVNDQLYLLKHETDSNKEGRNMEGSQKETKNKSPKKSRKASSEKKDKRSPSAKDKINTKTEIYDHQKEETELLNNKIIGDNKSYDERKSNETKKLNDEKQIIDNKSVKAKNSKKEFRKASEKIEDILDNNGAELINFENEEKNIQLEEDAKKEKIRSSRTPKSSKKNKVRSPKKQKEDFADIANGNEKDKYEHNLPETKVDETTSFESNNKPNSNTSRRRSSTNNDDKNSNRQNEGSSRKSNLHRNHERNNSDPERSENELNNIRQNDDPNHPYPRSSETAKSSSLDEGDVRFVIERKKDPDFSIKISMKDKQKRSRKYKETSNTDFSSTQYESDQSYVKDSGYISTTESFHRHRRSITIDLGHTRAKINAGMKNSSTPYDKENDDVKGEVSLPDVDNNKKDSSDRKNEKKIPTTPSSKTSPSKLPILSSHRQGTNSMVLTSYSRAPQNAVSVYMDGENEEDDSHNFDTYMTKNVTKKSPVRQVGHNSEQGAKKFTRYGSGIPIYRAQSDSNLQQLGKSSPRFSGPSLSTLSIPELNDLRVSTSERKMDSILEHSYSASDIPASINRTHSSIQDNLKLPSILLSRPEESGFYRSSHQPLSPGRRVYRSPKHSSPISSRVFTPDMGYLKLPILQQAVRCRCNIEPYEYWDGRRTKSAVECVANLHFLSEEELARFDQRLFAIGRRTSFSSDTAKRRSSPDGYRALRTQTLRSLKFGRKSAECLTFHVDHNKERNSFKLPTEKLKKNKKWKVTFTIGKSKKGKKEKRKESGE